jgi:HAD domain in Swiss Army Knife RNA repair proteins
MEVSMTASATALSNISGIIMEFLKDNQPKVHNAVYDVFVKSVVFLDIDGVLFHNAQDGSVGRKVCELFPGKDIYTDFECDIAATHLFDKTALSHLEKLLLEEDALVVLSSSWKDGKSVSKLKRIFAACFFCNRIIDKTPGEGYAPRCDEIAEWLSEHPGITNYVILDDRDEGLSQRFENNFVRVDIRKLLTGSDVEKAKKILA